MELRVLRYFLMVAREENITRAAGLLHVTQPTLSRQLIQLEEELGVKLFHRNKYRITLTEEGLLFKQRAQEIVVLSDKAKQELTKSTEQTVGDKSVQKENDSQPKSRKESVLQALRERQVKIKEQEQNAAKEKSRTHKKGEVSL